MGNPEILAHAAAARIEPPCLRVLWMAYRLRDRGEKLARDDVLRTGRLGLLQIRREGDDLTARLLDPSGYPTLDSLHGVRLVRHDVGGLVLHGTTLSVKSGVTSDVPQAWWCVVASAARIEPEGPLAGRDAG